MNKIIRPKITMSSQDKQAARSNMDGQKLLDTTTPDDAQTILQGKDLDQEQKEEVNQDDLKPVKAQQTTPSITAPKKGKKAVKPSEIDLQEDMETHAVRLTRSIVVNARINVLQLPKSMKIKNMREYGDAALLFFEAHLRKTGKLPEKQNG